MSCYACSTYSSLLRWFPEHTPDSQWLSGRTVAQERRSCVVSRLLRLGCEIRSWLREYLLKREDSSGGLTFG